MAPCSCWSCRNIGPVSLAAEQCGRAGIQDGGRVEPVNAVEVDEIGRLAEAVDAQGLDPVAQYGAEPGERGRVSVPTWRKESSG